MIKKECVKESIAKWETIETALLKKEKRIKKDGRIETFWTPCI